MIAHSKAKADHSIKLIHVVGARPNFMKAAPVHRAIAAYPHIRQLLVHTGQHYDLNMSDIFFRQLGLPAPDINLEVGSGSHAVQTAQIMMRFEETILREKPDLTLVYGDVNSTVAAALVCAKLCIPVGHVEAGLRSFNMCMPEEINRILTDRISHWLFAPTDGAVRHLIREGTDPDRIHQVGDVMYDAALYYGARAADRPDGAMKRLGLEDKGFVLATVHRAENTDNPMRLSVIVQAFAEVGRRLPVVWPLHPRTRGALSAEGMMHAMDGTVRIIDPVGYLDMVELEQSAAVIATDSGGVQKEAFFYRVPCVTLRDETEWVELVEAGWNRLASPTDAVMVTEAIQAAIGSRGADIKPYGDGRAAQHIAARLG